MKYLPWILIAAVLLVGYQWHAKRVGKLEGEIEARGKSIQQLGKLAAQRHTVYLKAKADYEKHPTLEGCSVVLSSCEQMASAQQSKIGELEKQVDSYKKLRKKDKLFGFLPRPTLQVGYCLTAEGKSGPCLSGGIPILK